MKTTQLWCQGCGAINKVARLTETHAILAGWPHRRLLRQGLRIWVGPGGDDCQTELKVLQVGTPKVLNAQW